MDSRELALTQWCQTQLQALNYILAENSQALALKVVSGDASFRRYFRIEQLSHPDSPHTIDLIAMDAPPEKEDSTSFVEIAEFWRQQGIRVPRILCHDLTLGFLLLEDFGDALLLGQLDANVATTQQSEASIARGNRLYTQAFEQLVNIQKLPYDQPDAPSQLPSYDSALLQREMALFKDWLIEAFLQIELSASEQQMLNDVFRLLEQSALTQKQVCVHRDFHSRNLMCLNSDELGVIDFQDAVWGPVTYDLVSLLRDCYVAWPEEQVRAWCDQFYKTLSKQGSELPDPTTFRRWFDLMGMQRHLKASGIFARLSLRDGKHGYLDDIPRTLSYLISVGKTYEETRSFAEWIERDMLPIFARRHPGHQASKANP